MEIPLDALTKSLQTTGIGRMVEHYARLCADDHLKDLEFESVGPGRDVVIQGRRVVNFGCDSFLGLDQDERVLNALRRGIEKWGTHSGASRAFASVSANKEAEDRLAEWLGCEACLIYPSVTLANLGAIPGLVGKQDLIAVDEFAHNSIQDGARLARGCGVRVVTFSHNDPQSLARHLTENRFRFALVCIDGVYSMSGQTAPLRELAAVCKNHNAVLYVDDAHGTGVMGPRGIGIIREELGSYDNVLVVGSLSKAFSCMGGFVGCTAAMKVQLKIRSNTYLFGGPVAPGYLEAILAVLEILNSPEYEAIIARLHANMKRFGNGATQRGFEIVGGRSPIISISVGDEEKTLAMGRFLFDRGCYVQSVIFPAVPYRSGVLRVQINANHEPGQIDRLLTALSDANVALGKSEAA